MDELSVNQLASNNGLAVTQVRRPIKKLGRKKN